MRSQVAAFTTTRSGLVWDGALLEGLCSTILTHSACGLIAELLALFHDHGLLHTHPARLAGLLLRLTYKAAMAAALALSYARLVKAYPIDAQRGVDALEWASEELRADKKIVLEAVKRHGRLLEHAAC